MKILNPQLQNQVSLQTPMPVDDMSVSSAVTAVTGETVQFYFDNSGTRTIDAGQAAGVAVSGQLANKNIFDSAGSRVASFNDTSLTFTSTAFTTEVRRPVDTATWETAQFDTWANKLAVATSGLANGEYWVDYRSGTLYGIKASSQVTLTSTGYSINKALSGGGGGVASDVNIDEIGGTTVVTGGVNGSLGIGGNVAHDDADAGNPVKIGGRARSTQMTAVAEDDRVDAAYNTTGGAIDAVYTYATQSNRSEEIDPLAQQHREITILDETNITTNTTGYVYIDMDNFRGFSIQGETSGATPTDVLTVTVEASNQDDGTDPASVAWQDVTNALFGVASWVDTDFFGIVDTQVPFKWVRVKYVTSNGGGNDADLTMFLKKMF